MKGRKVSKIRALLLLLVFLTLPVWGAAQSLDEDPLALNPEVAAFVDENVSRHSPPLERLRELIDLIFHDESLGFRYDTLTRTASQTFEERSGNCLSFTNMFIAMARHLGIDAHFREAETIPIWSQRGLVFTLSQHINVAVNMGSRWYLVDLFPEIGQMEIGGRVVSDERALAHFYNNRAVDHLSRGDTGEALRYLRRAMELESEAAFLWTNLGVARNQQGDTDGAVEAYRQALRLQPKHLPAIHNLSELYLSTGRADQARRYLARAQRFRNRNPYYHFNLGERAWAEGQPEEALRRYRKAVKLKREEHRFHFALARAYSRIGKTDRALRHLELASRFAPDESGRLRYHQKQRQLLAQSRP